MKLPRIEAGGRDYAVGWRSQLSPRLTEDGTIGQVERLDAQLEVLRAHHEPLVGRGVQADDPRSDQRVPLDGAVSERAGRRNAFDFRRRWTTSGLWDLPFGEGRKYLNGGGVVDLVLGGWQVGGILTLQDGFPFTLTCGPGTVQNGGGACYPDATGADWQLSGDERTRTRYFNTGGWKLR